MGIKFLQVEGNVELIVQQNKDHYQVKKRCLRSYRLRVWNAIDWFKAFNIKFIPREHSSRANSLAISATLFMPHSNFY